MNLVLRAQIFQRYLTFCAIGIQNAQLFEKSIQEFQRNQVSDIISSFLQYRKLRICIKLFKLNYNVLTDV